MRSKQANIDKIKAWEQMYIEAGYSDKSAKKLAVKRFKQVNKKVIG